MFNGYKCNFVFSISPFFSRLPSSPLAILILVRNLSCVDIFLCSIFIERLEFLSCSDHFNPRCLHTSVGDAIALIGPLYNGFSFKAYFPSPADTFSYLVDATLGASEACTHRSSGFDRSAMCRGVSFWEKRKLYRSYKQVPTASNLILFKATAACSRRLNHNILETTYPIPWTLPYHCRRYTRLYKRSLVNITWTHP